MILFVGRIILAFLEETWKGTGSGMEVQSCPQTSHHFFSEVCWGDILIIVKWTWIIICRFHNFYRLGYRWEILQNVIEFTKKELKSETNQKIWYDRCFFEPEPPWFSLLKLNVCNAYGQNIEKPSKASDDLLDDVQCCCAPTVQIQLLLMSWKESSHRFEGCQRQISNLPIPVWIYFVEQIWSLKCFHTSVWGIIRIRHVYLIVFSCLSPLVLKSHGGAGQVTGSMQEVTSMLIDKVMGDRCAFTVLSTGQTVPPEFARKTRSSLNCFFKGQLINELSGWHIFFHFFFRELSHMCIQSLYIWSLWILNITGPGPSFFGGGGGKTWRLKKWRRW